MLERLANIDYVALDKVYHMRRTSSRTHMNELSSFLVSNLNPSPISRLEP